MGRPGATDMSKPLPLAWFGQALLYGLFALFIGVFSSWPTYRHLPPDQALIKVSFSHQKHTAQLSLACAQCHSAERCSVCHNSTGQSATVGYKKPLHDVCLSCHKQMQCNDCHKAAA